MSRYKYILVLLLGWSLLAPLSSHAMVVDDSTVSQPDTFVNRYAVLAQNAGVGDTTLHIQAPASGAIPGIDALQAGDLLLVVQMQGAAMRVGASENDPSYGSLSSLNQAGKHEFVSVVSYDPNTHVVVLQSDCGGLKNAYVAAGHVQVVLVAQYKRLVVSQSGTVSAPAWDGQAGGVIAIQATDFQLEGRVDASGLGFRGGRGHLGSMDMQQSVFVYRSIDSHAGGEKGESVVGFGTEYDALGGRYGRGAPTNGGGGGNSYKSGGGGGANGNNGHLWTGHGVMDSAYPAAWQLDPAYPLNNALTDSSGGGRGGYSLSLGLLNPMSVAPGNPSWFGNARQAVGGFGGRPVASTPSRLFLGGGGGAGNTTNPNQGQGGSGGGLVYVLADAVRGNGSIWANGQAGQTTQSNAPGIFTDGAGGGGAGGTIVVRAKELGSVALMASGGSGGNQTVALGTGIPEAAGPGGSGGGGYIALPYGSVAVAVALGGQSAATNATAMNQPGSAFPPNGATQGAVGAVDRIPLFAPAAAVCIAADLGVTLTADAPYAVANQQLTHTLTFTNQGPAAVQGAIIEGDAVPPVDDAVWSCTPAIAFQDSEGTGALRTHVDLAVGQSVTCSVAVSNPSSIETPPMWKYSVQILPPTHVVDANRANNAKELELPFFAGQPPTPPDAGWNTDRSEYRLAGGGFGCNAAASTPPATLLNLVILSGFLVVSRLVHRVRKEKNVQEE